MAASHPLLRAADVQALEETRRPHALDPSIVRHTRSLGDAVGLETMGVHLVRLECGNTSTVHHYHHQDEEWVYILSGRGIAEIGDEKHEVGPGDFMGFTADSLPHCMHNANDEDLVYLVGGSRTPFDVCEYPRIRKRRYRINDKSVYVGPEIIDQADKA